MYFYLESFNLERVNFSIGILTSKAYIFLKLKACFFVKKLRVRFIKNYEILNNSRQSGFTIYFYLESFNLERVNFSIGIFT